MREGKPTHAPSLCVFQAWLCMCAHTFTAVKPNKHHPSASQGERTQVSVGVQLSRGWPRDRLSPCMRVFMTKNTERRLGDLSLTTIHCSVYFANINTLFYKDNLQWACQQVTNNHRANCDHFIHHQRLLKHVLCNSVPAKDQGKMWNYTPAFVGEIWKPDAFLRKTTHWQNKQAP